MSNQTEIERLETARDKIRTALINFGIADESAKLDALAKKIAAIRVQEATTITPSKTEQTAVYPQRYTKGAITVAPIPNKYQDVSEVTTTADEVLEGNKFVDKNGNVVTGTMPICASYDAILDTTTTTHMIPAGYHEGDGSVSIVLEEKTVTPTDTQQIITPSEGCVLSKVTVEAAESGGGGSTTQGFVSIPLTCSTNGGAVQIISDGTTITNVSYHSAVPLGSLYRVMINEACVGAAIVVFEAMTTAPPNVRIIRTGSNYTVIEAISSNSGGDSGSPDGPFNPGGPDGPFNPGGPA